MTDNNDDEEDFYESGNVRDQEDEPDERRGIGDNSGDEDLEGLDLEDLLKEGRTLLLKTLIYNVKNGLATPQEMNTLRQMLKDNGMVLGDPFDGDEPTDRKKADLPEYTSPDYAT